jgi:plastocyanin
MFLAIYRPLRASVMGMGNNTAGLTRGYNCMSKMRIKHFTLALIIAALGSVMLASCIRPGTPIANNGATPTTSGGGTPTVHLTSTNFAVSSITIPKGSMLKLVDDVDVVHILKNGSWVNGNQVPKKEAGAPTVNVTFNGNDTHEIGPFNTPGTYHIFCTVHPNMNLTITVTNSSASSGSAKVDLTSNNFAVPSITINKGSTLTLVDTVDVVHILKNGSWVNGNQVPKQEAGAPTVNVQFNGNDTHTIGPFNTAGTFHIFCTVHPNMNLTIIVK